MRSKLEITNHVQDVGFRSIVTATLIEKGIKKAIVENDEQDPKKLIIIVDEEQKTLDKIMRALNNELRNKREFPQLPEEFHMSEWEEMNGNPPAIPDISPYASDALQLKQISKFVGVGLGMSKNIEHMSSRIDSMDKSIKELPENLAKELVKLKKEGVL
ncbi:MAG: hypothetical protein ISS93_03625 [Candidatus Aenigmarchaeota archaeon]|nr:hypothetical protein [Candidatus Aenigmarchaeota archaeon]